MTNISGTNAILSGNVTANGTVNAGNVVCNTSVACSSIASTSMTTNNANVAGLLSLSSSASSLIQFNHGGISQSITTSDLNDIATGAYLKIDDVDATYATKTELTTGLNSKATLASSNTFTEVQLSTALPTTENSSKVGTTSWVKSVLGSYHLDSTQTEGLTTNVDFIVDSNIQNYIINDTTNNTNIYLPLITTASLSSYRTYYFRNIRAGANMYFTSAPSTPIISMTNASSNNWSNSTIVSTAFMYVPISTSAGQWVQMFRA